jgi:hypothetical protein
MHILLLIDICIVSRFLLSKHLCIKGEYTYILLYDFYYGIFKHGHKFLVSTSDILLTLSYKYNNTLKCIGQLYWITFKMKYFHFEFFLLYLEISVMQE